MQLQQRLLQSVHVVPLEEAQGAGEQGVGALAVPERRPAAQPVLLETHLGVPPLRKGHHRLELLVLGARVQRLLDCLVGHAEVEVLHHLLHRLLGQRVHRRLVAEVH